MKKRLELSAIFKMKRKTPRAGLGFTYFNPVFRTKKEMTSRLWIESGWSANKQLEEEAIVHVDDEIVLRVSCLLVCAFFQNASFIFF